MQGRAGREGQGEDEAGGQGLRGQGRRRHALPLQRMTAKHALSLLACVLLGACATTGRLEPPAIRVTDITMDYFTSADARFTIQVTLTNPNLQEVAVEALTAELRIENVPVGSAQLAAPVRVPARGEATASIV